MDKEIAELEELLAKATPGEWDWNKTQFGVCDIPLIIAMHNYLPKLIAEIKKSRKGFNVLTEPQNKFQTDLITMIIARAKRAEEEARLTNEELQCVYDELIREIKKTEEAEREMIIWKDTAFEWKANFEQMQAERDYLAQKLATPVTIDLLNETIIEDQIGVGFDQDVQEILTEAHEAAKRKTGDA